MGKPAILVLEDGTTFEGKSFGKKGKAFGEVVFNTSMSGYQEILTDPSYTGQIITMTYPHIGNYGVNPCDNESRRPFVEGFVVREKSAIFSNWQAKDLLENFLKQARVVGIEGVDTRALTKHIRSVGAIKGVISTNDLDQKSLLKEVRAFPSIVGRDLVKGVTASKTYWWRKTKATKQFKVVAFDFGIKLNILRELEKRSCDVLVVPASTSAEKVLSFKPDGIFLSNGPGDPAAVYYAIDTIRQLIGKKPIFGICLGHQLLALALGGKTYKLKFGHRGANQPVKNLLNGKVEITSQNHGFAVNAKAFSVKLKGWQVGSSIELGGWPGKSNFGQLEITHLNLNDGTVEGLRCLGVPAFSVQYHPEASPGPHDSKYLFEQFIQIMETVNQ